MNDTTSSLYEHLKNRLATGYGYGDDQQVVVDNIPDHRCSYQSIRESNEGDVGIFEYIINRTPSMDGINSHALWETNVQISAVVKDGDIQQCKKYLLDSYNNFVNDVESSNVYVRGANLLNIRPAGKNSEGLQMCIINFKIYYYINTDTN